MILIAHRGNTTGANASLENHPNYIEEALKLGYDCEVDVWYKNDGYWLGHDEPVYDIGKSFLRNDKLWCHAKNLEALDMMLNDNIHCFWHEEDDFTLTSKGYIWTYPEKELTRKSICITLNLKYNKEDNCFGICSDYVGNYKL